MGNPKGTYTCSDGMCGALDCYTCYGSDASNYEDEPPELEMLANEKKVPYLLLSTEQCSIIFDAEIYNVEEFVQGEWIAKNYPEFNKESIYRVVE